jgi:hypothetical protein
MVDGSKVKPVMFEHGIGRQGSPHFFWIYGNTNLPLVVVLMLVGLLLPGIAYSLTKKAAHLYGVRPVPNTRIRRNSTTLLSTHPRRFNVLALDAHFASRLPRPRVALVNDKPLPRIAWVGPPRHRPLPIHSRIVNRLPPRRYLSRCWQHKRRN